METGTLNQSERNVVQKSVEQSQNENFAKVFSKDDWPLFKLVAESYLEEATRLKKRSNMQVPPDKRLLLRNIRKRLFIGLGVELLLKAVYLKCNFGINLLGNRQDLYSLERLTQDPESKANANKTLSLDFLIRRLSEVITLTDGDSTRNGLTLARGFRNKEGHVVAPTHLFVAETYSAIEGALVRVYQDAFSEKLEVTFSMAPLEKAVWRTSALNANSIVAKRV